MLTDYNPLYGSIRLPASNQLPRRAISGSFLTRRCTWSSSQGQTIVVRTSLYLLSSQAFSRISSQTRVDEMSSQQSTSRAVTVRNSTGYLLRIQHICHSTTCSSSRIASTGSTTRCAYRMPITPVNKPVLSSAPSTSSVYTPVPGRSPLSSRLAGYSSNILLMPLLHIRQQPLISFIRTRTRSACYEPPLRPEAQAWGAHAAENLMACGEVTQRSRDGSRGSVYEDLGSIGSRTPLGSSTAQRSI